MTVTFASPVAATASRTTPPARAPKSQTTDLAPALGADGTFRGGAGIAGTIDTDAWTLVSDLATGEPPRFAPAVGASDSTASFGLNPNGLGGGPMTGTVNALAVSGSNVYVGGNFINVAGIFPAAVNAIAVSGSNVYVGGNFINVAGIATADYVARWNGNDWSALKGLAERAGGNGSLNNSVYALAVSGSDLYVGGSFTNAAGIATADFLARWNGSNWFAVGSNGAGNGAFNSYVVALAVSGSDLYVGGNFTNAAGVAAADFLAHWNGSNWSALGSNGAGNGALNKDVYALAVSGSNLYIGGLFTNAAGVAAADHVARWNGSNWSALGSNGAGNGALNDNVFALAISGGNVYVGGIFTNAAGKAKADFVARWNGSEWFALGSNGAGNGALNSLVYALAVSGGNVYVGGIFTNAAGKAKADFVARWNGSKWRALGSNGAGNGALNSRVHALAVSGSNVYVGGVFMNAAGIAEADHVARWDGSNWSALE